MTPERLAVVREREQGEAARVLGVKEVVFLGHPDGGLEDSRGFRGENGAGGPQTQTRRGDVS